MNIVILVLLGVILLSFIIMIVFLAKKKPGNGTLGNEEKNIEKYINFQFENQKVLLKEINESNKLILNEIGRFLSEKVKDLMSMQSEHFERDENRLNDMQKNLDVKMDKILTSISQSLKEINDNNEKKLEEMRQTVDEKLTSTLEKRLSASVQHIVDGIEKVSKGIGEMQTIASGISDFKNMIANVKTRGSWGEVQLGILLEQMLAPCQFDSQVSIAGREKVDYVVKLPGKDERTLFLPIDSKFPMQDYQNLCDASERGDLKQVETYGKSLEKKIKEEAKSIKEKYISVPITTDFAIMYLPVEGLYAEIVRRPNLLETIQKDYKILICGPTTLSALLTSLQMGFKTLAIEKRSSEIWATLGVFKQEFSKFVELLSKTQKQINLASDTIEFATKKTKTIQKKLRDVAIYEDDQPEIVSETDD